MRDGTILDSDVQHLKAQVEARTAEHPRGDALVLVRCDLLAALIEAHETKGRVQELEQTVKELESDVEAAQDEVEALEKENDKLACHLDDCTCRL